MNQELPVPTEEATEGLVTIASDFEPKETMDRLENVVRAQKMQVFARIDHATAAEKVELKLRPTELLIFGNAEAGTPLMQSAQTIGIDLPLKALVWQDSAGRPGFPTTSPTGLRSATRS